MDTERAKALFIELRDHLRKQNSRDLDIQTRNAAKAVQYLEAASSEEEKEEIIKTSRLSTEGSGAEDSKYRTKKDHRAAPVVL